MNSKTRMELAMKLHQMGIELQTQASLLQDTEPTRALALISEATGFLKACSVVQTFYGEAVNDNYGIEEGIPA